jgi:rare lipoprotein A
VAIPQGYRKKDGKPRILAKLMKTRCSLFGTAVTFVAAFLALTGCTKRASQTGGQVQTGVASWYGHPFDGRLTANGETYDMEKMTAAHKTFPFGAVLRVENLANGKTTEVRINDRGPFVQGRIIDLSHAAAQAISMPGVATVRLQVISIPPTRGADLFAVQVGSFSQRLEAEKLRAQLEGKYGTAKLVFRDGNQSWSVLVGLEPTIESADTLALQLEHEAGPAFVVLVDSAQ